MDGRPHMVTAWLPSAEMGLGHYTRAGSVSLFDGLTSFGGLASFSFDWRLFCPICTFYPRFMLFFPDFCRRRRGGPSAI